MAEFDDIVSAELSEYAVLPATAEKKRRKTGRHRFWLPIIIVSLFACGYGSFWYLAADKAEKKAAAYFTHIFSDGYGIKCDNLRKSGFPLRIAVSCDAFSVNADTVPAARIDDKTDDKQATGGKSEDAIAVLLNRESADNEANANSASAAGSGAAKLAEALTPAGLGGAFLRSGAVEIGAPVYAPHWLRADIAPPLRVQLPFAKEITASWKTLQSEADFSRGKPRKLSLTAENLSVSGLPATAHNTPSTVKFLRFDGEKTAENKITVQFSFDSLFVPYTLKGAAAGLPPTDGTADMVIDNADTVLSALQRFMRADDKTALRGHSAVLRKLVLHFEKGGAVTVSGPVSVSETGRLNAGINLAVKDASALAHTVRNLFPAQASTVESVFFVLNAMPKNKKGEPQLRIDIIDGNIRLGFLKLGKIAAM